MEQNLLEGGEESLVETRILNLQISAIDLGLNEGAIFDPESAIFEIHHWMNQYTNIYLYL